MGVSITAVIYDLIMRDNASKNIGKVGAAMQRQSKDADKAKGSLGGFAEAIAGVDAACGRSGRRMSLFSKGLLAVNLATGVLEPALAGVVVAAGALSGALVAGGAGLGAYGLVLANVGSEMKQMKKLQTAVASGQKGAGAKLKQFMQQSTPGFRAFAGAVSEAQTSYAHWARSLEGPVLAPITAGLKLTKPLLAGLTPLTKAASSAISILVGELSQLVLSPRFTHAVQVILPHVKPTILDLAHAAGNLALGLWGVMKAFLPMSGAMTGGVTKLTAKFKEWGQSLPSHSGFKSLMKMFRDQTPAAMGVLRNLATIIKNVAAATIGLATPANSKALLNILGPLTQIIAKLSQNEALVRFVLYVLILNSSLKKLGMGVTAVSQSLSGLTSAGKGISNLSKGFRDAEVASSAASGTMGTMGGKLKTVYTWFSKTAIGQKILTGLTWAWGIAMKFALGPVGLIILALVALGVAFYLAWTKSATFRKIVIGVWHAIWDVTKQVIGNIVHAAQNVWHALTTAFSAVLDWVRHNWPLLLGLLTGPIGLAVALIITHWKTVVGFFTAVWNTIKRIFAAAWAWILAGITAEWNRIRNGARVIWNAIAGFFRGIWNVIKTVFSAAWNWLTHGLAAAWNRISTGLRREWNAIAGFFRSIWNGIKTVAGAAVDWIRSRLSSAWANIKKAAIAAFNGMKTGIRDVWNGIKSVVSGPVNWVLDHVWNPFASLINKVLGFFGVKFRLPSHAAGGPAAPAGHVPAMAGGGELHGLVRGPGGPRADRVGPVMLSDQEFVMQGSAVAKYGVPFMWAVNEGKLPPLGMQGGGWLGGVWSGITHAASGAFHWATNTIGKLVKGAVGGVVRPIVNSMEGAIHRSMPQTGWGQAVGGAIKMPLEAFKKWVAKKDAQFGGGDIVRDALSFLGKIPYVMGGNSLTSGIDCSGFTQQIYGRHGITAPRTSETQFAWVKRGPPVPGGLAFYVSPGGGPPPGHVAIVRTPTQVISQGGGMGPTLEALHYMPLMGTGIPPGGLPKGTGTGGNGPSLLQNLWRGAGGSSGSAAIASAIGMAESGGRSIMQQGQPPGLTGWGIWQITPTSGLNQNGMFGNLLNPQNNARAAVYLWRQAGQSFRPWATYNSGAYRQFMEAGGPVQWYANGLAGGVFDRPTLIGVGEKGRERVDITPAGSGGDLIKEIRALRREVMAMHQTLAKAPVATGQVVGAAINGTSRKVALGR